ncbi:hypothetical protein CHS0354_008031 [Potamilus streckersoni]|uniref:ATP synthase subunit f, mitochondrial n=1 Tax=Potamilus streckersoni TaxID=2493646 RepID=A0AAE0VE80_9BIVA|nr:hypothetical protein CHS0354_008031 [Potamilus streckersoni]
MGNIGCYPVEYNPKVHGPYSPARYYGPRDIPFSEVKLQDVPAWISRRKFNPIRTVNRAYWRWVFKYGDVKKGGFSWIMQLAFFMAAGSYMLRYNQHKYERHAKYH